MRTVAAYSTRFPLVAATITYFENSDRLVISISVKPTLTEMLTAGRSVM